MGNSGACAIFKMWVRSHQTRGGESIVGRYRSIPSYQSARPKAKDRGSETARNREWNEWLVTQVCRRIGLGRALAPPAPSIESALLQLAEIAKRRRQRGYQIAELMSTSQTKEKDRGNGK